MSFIRTELRSHPRLRSITLRDVVRTGKTIGSGSYGTVEEVAIPGALCAAKKIHDCFAKQDSEWVAKDDAEGYLQKFLSECTITSRLRHPHIVQFLGLWYEENQNLYLVMEKMMTSLHDLLESNSSNTAQPGIPLGLKVSILQDVARGLAFLHKQAPPVIHRDLSARNVLLNSAMTAKIADLGMARIMPPSDKASMTKAPGALVYMPPEALDDSSSYNASIDIFSLGVIAVFVLSEQFPQNPKSPTYTDDKKGLVARTELQRREEYTRTIYITFPTNHPLIHLMESCLHNAPKERPSTDRVLELLDEALAGVPETHHTISKLELIQMLEKSVRDLQLFKESCTTEAVRVRTSSTKGRREPMTKPRSLHIDHMGSKNIVAALLPAKLPSEKDVLPSGPWSKENLSTSDNLDLPLSKSPPKQKKDLDLKAHRTKEHWYRDISRYEAVKLLSGCEDGTFLCRPTTRPTKHPEGGIHTHTIDTVCDGIKHVKVIVENEKYGLSTANTFDSLVDLVIHYSQHPFITSKTFLLFPRFCK